MTVRTPRRGPDHTDPPRVRAPGIPDAQQRHRRHQTQILQHVWDAHYAGPDNVVEVYMGYLRRKIDTPFGTTTIETVRGVGYRLGSGLQRQINRHDRPRRAVTDSHRPSWAYDLGHDRQPQPAAARGARTVGVRRTNRSKTRSRSASAIPGPIIGDRHILNRPAPIPRSQRSNGHGAQRCPPDCATPGPTPTDPRHLRRRQISPHCRHAVPLQIWPPRGGQIVEVDILRRTTIPRSSDRANNNRSSINHLHPLRLRQHHVPRQLRLRQFRVGQTHFHRRDDQGRGLRNSWGRP